MPFETEIQTLTQSIWESTLNMAVEPENGPLPSGCHTMSSCIHITGSWRGAVTLSCDVNLAAEAAGIMFGLDKADALIADMQDAMGELVNMIGGNVKALLPELCQLSLPSVVEGSDYSVRIPGSVVVARVPMRCGIHAMNVTLLEQAA